MPPSVDQLGLDDGSVLQRLMRRIYPTLLAQAYADAADALSVDLAFDVENEFVQEVLDELAAAVKGVADTTKAEIGALIGKGAEEGWSTDELAKAIEQLGEMTSKSRARTIAVTESAAAYTKGSVLAWTASGVVTEVEWLDADGCDVCGPLGGTRVPLGDTFPGGLTVPAHPNCRCSLAPIVG